MTSFPAFDIDTIPYMDVEPSPAVVWARREISSMELEEYRIIRTKLAQHSLAPKVILISSGDVGDGKSVTTCNLAGMLAVRGNNRVLLLDADMRKPTISNLLGIPQGLGLNDILRGNATPQEVCKRVRSNPPLYVIPAGSPDQDAGDLLQTDHWANCLAHFRETFDFIVMDAPPVGAVADYELLEAVSDGVVFVVRTGHTNRMLCFEAIERLPKDKLLGVIMNASRDWLFWKSTRYYPYGKTSSLARKL